MFNYIYETFRTQKIAFISRYYSVWYRLLPSGVYVCMFVYSYEYS